MVIYKTKCKNFAKPQIYLIKSIKLGYIHCFAVLTTINLESVADK